MITFFSSVNNNKNKSIQKELQQFLKSENSNIEILMFT